MTNDTQPSPPTTPPTKESPTPLGARLKSAREALGLNEQDAANQLRLNEKVILMMEKDKYPDDLPITFIRGYLRAYGKLLQIPEYEIKKAIEPLKPLPLNPDAALPYTKPLMTVPVTSGNYFMQFFTYLIIFTMVGLVGIWWYTHPTSTPKITAAESSTVPSSLPIATPQPATPATAEPMIAPNPEGQPVTATQTQAVNNAPAPIEPTKQPLFIKPENTLDSPKPTTHQNHASNHVNEDQATTAIEDQGIDNEPDSENE